MCGRFLCHVSAARWSRLATSATERESIFCPCIGVMGAVEPSVTTLANGFIFKTREAEGFYTHWEVRICVSIFLDFFGPKK